MRAARTLLRWLVTKSEQATCWTLQCRLSLCPLCHLLARCTPLFYSLKLSGKKGGGSKVLKRHPGVFEAFISIHLKDPCGAVEVLDGTIFFCCGCCCCFCRISVTTFSTVARLSDSSGGGSHSWRVDGCRRQGCDGYTDCLAACGQTLPQLLSLQNLLWASVERGVGVLQLGQML